jgi:hypothetical protein
LPENDEIGSIVKDNHFIKLIAISDAATCLAAIISDVPNKVHKLCTYTIKKEVVDSVAGRSSERIETLGN